jgi:SAM-dependent methyltransferase
MSTPSILDEVAAYYGSKLAEYGPTAKGVDWNSEDSHALRHQQFLRLIGEARDASVLDLGCGFGDFRRFLQAQGHRGPFIGYDVAPGMIAAAARLHGEGPHCRWRVGAVPEESVDFAVASGIFNVKRGIPLDRWQSHVRGTIDVLARAARRGFAFNMLSLSSDPERRRPDLYYADAAAMLAYCVSRFGRSVALMQDYGLYEFTVIVRQSDGAEEIAACRQP